MNNKQIYEKIGYKNVIKNLNEKDTRLLTNYILPLYIRENKITYPICLCGYVLENSKNSKCFVCNNETMYLNEYYYHSEYIKPKNKLVEIDTFRTKNKINKVSDSKVELLYANGFILFEIKDEKPILDLSKVKENNLTISVEEDDYVFYFNGEKSCLFDFIFNLKKHTYSWQNNIDNILLNLFLNIENHPFQYQQKIKDYKETNALYLLELEQLEKDYNEKRSLFVDNTDKEKEYFYRKERNKAQNLFNSKDASIFSLKQTFLKTILKDIFKKELNNLNKNLKNVILNEILLSNSNFRVHDFIKQLEFFMNNKNIKDISNFEDIFYLPESLYFIIKLKMNTRWNDFSLLPTIKKENLERMNIFFEQKDKLNKYNLSPESYYELLLIMNKIDLNIDELIEYIDHLVEHEGLVPIEVIEYYDKYVKKSSLKKLNEIPMPANLKLNANK